MRPFCSSGHASTKSNLYVSTCSHFRIRMHSQAYYQAHPATCPHLRYLGRYKEGTPTPTTSRLGLPPITTTNTSRRILSV
ncbi:hypothetical protein C8R42DRAFT_441295 [Lentinula raphanica]|nr:hypothetical protein C8R42DRAFT_441295 [Lentinula raphanica]